MKENKRLYLVLTGEWYDAIDSGKKLEEYRDIKPYYNSRFEGRSYDEVVFAHGYETNSRKMRFRVKKISRNFGKLKYGGDPQCLCWVVYLGERLTDDR